jgi:hypothetical protein
MFSFVPLSATGGRGLPPRVAPLGQKLDGTTTPSSRPARKRMMAGLAVLKKNRTEPSQYAKWTPPGCRLVNACGAVPLTAAESSSTHHMTSLM